MFLCLKLELRDILILIPALPSVNDEEFNLVPIASCSILYLLLSFKLNLNSRGLEPLPRFWFSGKANFQKMPLRSPYKPFKISFLTQNG